MMIDPDGASLTGACRTGARVPDELGRLWPPADLLAAVRRDFAYGQLAYAGSLN